MGEVVSADVLAWARDLNAIQLLLSPQADAPAGCFEPKVVQLSLARRAAHYTEILQQRAIA